MMRLIIAILFMASFAAAQSKKPAPGSKAGQKATKADTTNKEVAEINPADTIDPKDREIREARKFAVYSKRAPAGKDRRLKLCINLVKNESTLNYCVNDTVCKYPETYKTLFEKQEGDTNYVLVFIDAFSKAVDKPSCDAGKETKLYFARWNLKTNKAEWSVKIISSCMKGVTNMSKSKIGDWTGPDPLIATYHKGGSEFIDVMFDPKNYKAGFQKPKEDDLKKLEAAEENTDKDSE